MVGLLILVTALLPFFVLSRYTMPGMALVFVTVGCAAIGFTDDYSQGAQAALARAFGTLEDGRSVR